MSDDEQQQLEDDLSKEELLSKLKGFKENKTQGEDGFTKEFYETFFDLVGDHLLESYNEAFDKGKMSISQRGGIISLIPKGENSRSFSMIFSPHRITTSTEVEIWNFHITNEKVYL